MAGFREFVTGEVLTAANVDDFLMKQTVQKYADAAARDAALGTAVAGGNALREGMVAYLDDTNDIQKYDGSAWATIGAAGIGSNVVAADRSTTFTTSSTSMVDVTDLSVVFTPSTATSKVLLMFSSPAVYSNSAYNNGVNVEITATSGTSPVRIITNLSTGTAGSKFAAGSVVLHSPGTTSAVTYQVRIQNVFSGPTANVDGPSTLIAIEVAA